MVYAGTTLSSLTDLGSTTWSPGYIALFVLQIVAIVVVIVVVVIIGRREYNKIMAQGTLRFAGSRARRVCWGRCLTVRASDGGGAVCSGGTSRCAADG